MFEKIEPHTTDSSAKNTPEVPIENSQENIEAFDAPTMEEAKKEVETLLAEDFSENTPENGQPEEKISKWKSVKGKMVAMFVATTIFAGAFAQTAEAGGYKRGISGSLEKGAGSAIEDIFRGTGRGTSAGMNKGMEKTVLNAFGIETQDQRRDRERHEKETYRRAEQAQKNYQKAVEQKERAYYKEMDAASRENDKNSMSVLKDYQKGSLTKEKKDELMQEMQEMYKKKVSEIDARYNNPPSNSF